jgi:carbonic anhydrase
MPSDVSAGVDVDRRKSLQPAINCAVAGIAARSGFWPASVPRLQTQTPLSPDPALQQLLAGNQRFDANQLTSMEQDRSILNAHTVEKHEPFAAVLACADTRLPRDAHLAAWLQRTVDLELIRPARPVTGPAVAAGARLKVVF